MAMTKTAFAACLEPMMGRWRDGDMPGGVLQEYYAALGGFTESQVSQAVHSHMAHGKGFARVGELRRIITGEEIAPRKRKSYDDDPEFARHHRATERVFEKLLLVSEAGNVIGIDSVPEPEGTFRYRIADVAQKAVECFNAERRERTERSAMSCAYAEIWLGTIKRFA